MTCTVFVQVLIDGTLPLLFLYTFCMPGKHFDCQEYLYTVHCSQCLVLCGPFTLISYFSFPLLTVGRTRKVIPPPWYKGKGGWWTPPPPWVFEMLQYFETVLPSVKSFWSSLQDEVFVIGGVAVGGLWRHQKSWSPSWVFSRIRNRVKTVKINNVLRLTCKITDK